MNGTEMHDGRLATTVRIILVKWTVQFGKANPSISSCPACSRDFDHAQFVHVMLQDLRIVAAERIGTNCSFQYCTQVTPTTFSLIDSTSQTLLPLHH